MSIRVPFRGGGSGDSPDDLPVVDRAARIEALLADSEFLLAYAQRITGDAASAEDVVQDTFVQALRHLDRIDRRDSYKPWLATVALRRALNEKRRRARATPVMVVPDCEAAEGDPMDGVIGAEHCAEVIRALATLTPRERLLLERRAIEGISVADLAAQERSTVASVRSVLRRARSKLRAALEDRRPVLVPSGLPGWLRRRLDGVACRLQQAVPTFPGGIERAGDALTAAVALLAIGVAPQGASPRMAEDDRLAPFAMGATVAAVTEAAPHAGPAPSQPAAVGAMRRPGDDDTPPTHPEPEATPNTPEPDSPGNPPLLRVPTAAPSPAEPDAPPAPSSPMPRDDSDDPEGAFFTDIVWAGDAASTGAGRDVFALGAIEHRCDTGCTVLFHSRDGGATWNRLPADGIGDQASDLMVAPAYPRDGRIFVMTPAGLRRSVDGGVTFTPVNEPHSGPAAMSPAFSSGDPHILVGASPGWRYDAAADVTTPMRVGSFATPAHIHYAFAPDPAGGLFFAGHFVHAEGGVKAPAVTRCIRDMCDRHVLLGRSVQPPKVYVPPASPATHQVVLAWHDGGFFRSDDAGASFERVEIGRDVNVESVVGDQGGDLYLGWWDLGSGKRSGGVLRSVDGGQTWSPVGAGSALDDGVNDVGVSPQGVLLAAPRRHPEGGLLCSGDSGLTWSPRCQAR